MAGHNLRRTLVLFALSLPIMWVSAGTSLALWSNGGVTLPLVPFSHPARLTAELSQAWAAGTLSNAAQSPELRNQALSAFRRRPASVAAARNLSLIEAVSGHAARAGRLLAYAQQLSRRDSATQMLLIEVKVGQGDVIGALHHYDVALRTTASTRDLLFPVLYTAADDPAVTPAFARLLAHRPLWWADFVQQYAGQNHSTVALAAIAAMLRLNPSIVGERQLLSYILARLVQQGDVGHAHALYARARGGQVSAIADGGFDSEPVLPPFDWTLSGDGDVQVELGPRRGGNKAALVTVASGSSGVALRQLLTLAPGHYLLSYRAGTTDNAAPAITTSLTCVQLGTALTTDRYTPASDRNRDAGEQRQVSMTVPAGCQAQALTVTATASDADGEEAAWLDDVAVRRVTG